MPKIGKGETETNSLKPTVPDTNCVCLARHEAESYGDCYSATESVHSGNLPF